MFIVYSTNTSKNYYGSYDTNITLVGIAKTLDIVKDLIKKEKQNLFETYTYLNESNIDREYIFEYKKVNKFAINTNISVELY